MISKKKLALSKMFMSRTAGYLALVNAGMILFLVMSRLEDYGFDINIEIFFFPILILGFLMLGVFGWLEDHLGFINGTRTYRRKKSVYGKNTQKIGKN